MSNQLMRCMWSMAVLFAAIAAGPVIGWTQEAQSTFIQHFDQNQDGLVSQDEFPGSQDEFEVLDINGDGYLDDSEAPRHPRRRGPGPQDIIARYDADGDGLLSTDEFPGPQDHFVRLDTDGDGYLSQSELAAGPPGPDQGSAFEKDDADGDGRVSKAEFSGPEGFFDELDIDGDGYITREEARTAGPPPGPPPAFETGAKQQ